MHILFFSDNHPDSLGGVQTSVMLQKKYLERAGHRVTVVTSLRYRRKKTAGFIEVPALPLPPTGAYSVAPSLHLSFRKLERSLAEIAEPVDLVHIQGDMWMGILGAAWAVDHKLPLIQTIHTNLQVGFEHNVGKVGRRSVAQVMNRWAASFLNQELPERINSLWAFQEQVARHCNFVCSPSNHFNEDLIKHGVVSDALVFPNGVDDDIVEGVQRSHHLVANDHNTADRTVNIIWAGRMSLEKRILEFLGAFAQADLKNVKLDIYGAGQIDARVRLQIRQLGLHKVAKMHGRIPHKDLVRTFADADLVCQSSIGFETQGMTVYESVMVGTPVFVVDPKIAGELPADNVWLTKKPDVDSMAKTLKTAVADIRAGKTKRFDLDSEWSVLQSKLTARMIEIYETAIEQGPKNLNG